MGTRGILRSLSAGTAAFLIGVACGSPAPPAAEGVPAGREAGAAPVTAAASTAVPPVATVRLGYLPIMSHAPFFVAQEKGYWREAGVEVEGTEFQGSDQMMPFLASGQLDVAGGSAGAGFLNALYQGVSGSIVATMSGVSPDGPSPGALVVRQEDYHSGRYTHPGQLRGRRVAANGTGVYGEFLLDRALRLGGITINDVDFVTLSFPDMVTALAGGSLDAALLTEPWVVQVEERGLGVPIARERLDPNGQTQVVLYGEQFMRNNSEGARRFMVGYLRALRDLKRTDFKDPGDAVIIEKYTKLRPEVILRSVPPYVDGEGRVNIAHLELQQRFYLERGYLNYREPLDLQRFVDYSWLEYARQQLGPYQP